MLRFRRRGQKLACIQLLAPHELVAPEGWEEGGVEWIDAEGGEELSMPLDRRVREAYDALLSRRLESMRSVCARHRIAYGVWPSDAAFETVLDELV